jgi:ribosomal protein S18 acetylase RimI-like enzyme
MQKSDIPQAAEVLGKAFATTPGSLAIYRGKPKIARRMQIFFEGTLKSGILKSEMGNCFVAELDSQVVGVMKICQWPACYEMSLAMGLKLMPALLRSTGGLGTLMRKMKFIGALRKHDPKRLHWHLQFFGVAPDFQGKGIGSKMMVFYCDIIDRNRMEAYHETGTENVPFYQRFGFKVAGEEIINGVKNLYMLRLAKLDK